MKILSINQNYNNKAQSKSQTKGNVNFSAVLVKSNFELFGHRKSLAQKLLDGIHFSFPTKLSALANKTRGNSKNYVHSRYSSEPLMRRHEVHLSDKEIRDVDDALVVANNAIKADYTEQKAHGRDCLDMDNIGQVIDRLWELPAGSMRELRNLAEKLFADAQNNPIEHVVTACAARLAEANNDVGHVQREISTELGAALNGRRFPEQLEFPFPEEKLKRKIRFGTGGMLDDLSSFRHPWSGN
jgi:hypothetical protein